MGHYTLLKNSEFVESQICQGAFVVSSIVGQAEVIPMLPAVRGPERLLRRLGRGRTILFEFGV